MRIRYLFAFALLIILLIPAGAMAFTVNPTAILETLPASDVKTVGMNITNTDPNSSITVTITSTDTSLVEPGVTTVEINANKSFYFSTLIKAPITGGTYMASLSFVTPNKTILVPISITSTTQQLGHLEPSFTKQMIKIMQDTIKSRVLSIRNLFPAKVEIKDAIVENSIIGEDGIERPISIEGDLGWLESGEDMVLTIYIDTMDLEPGTYSPKIKIAYYYQSVRYTLDISFELTVMSTLSPDSGTATGNYMVNYIPLEPLVGDYVYAEIINSDTQEIIIPDGLFVTIYGTVSDEQLTSFDYTNPFIVDSGKRYCIKSKTYNATESCFNVRSGGSYIKISPEEPTANETVMVQYVDDEGYVIAGGSLVIDGTVYNESQISIVLDEGSHMIEGFADNFDSATLPLEVMFPIILERINSTLYVGQTGHAVFNRMVDWKIFDSNNSIMTQGSNTEFSYRLMVPGNYSLVVANDTYGIIFVFSGAPGFDFDINTTTLIVIIALILFLILVYPGKMHKKIFKKRRKTLEIGYYPSVAGAVEKVKGLRKKEDD